MWRRNVGFVDAIVLCSSNLQQGSDLSGVVGWMICCICTCVTNIIFMKGVWMFLGYSYAV